MPPKPIYQAVAEAFVAEGMTTHFTLMGDGNMHFATALRSMPEVRTVHVRHEHSACAMAIGHAGITGTVGVASVTCGPGFTQVTTALATASRNRIPLVLFAGEPPMHAAWYLQAIDQRALALPTGAHYISITSARRVHEQVREAFYVARTQRRPVVLAIPYDLQKDALPTSAPYQPAETIIPDIGRPLPDARQIAQLAEALLAAERPILVAGRGVLAAGCEGAVELLAARTGALLGTTLPARGLFDSNPYGLGICGGYARPVARDLAAKSDLVVMLGASITQYTLDGGRMFPAAKIAQIDLAPLGFNNGLRTGDLHLCGDVGATVEALLAHIGERPARSVLRTPEVARRLRDEPDDLRNFPIDDGTLDPRAVVAALDSAVPKDFYTIEGAGHSSFFPSAMRGRDPRRHLALKEFGAIGNALCFAAGVAAHADHGRVMLIDGDGGALMHAQEFETLQREGLKLLLVVMNDGAFGAEIHKLRHQGLDDGGAVFGRPDFAAIARGFGLRGVRVGDLAALPGIIEDYLNGPGAMVLDMPISDQVVSPRMAAGLARGHGKA